ncbi:hypothetical protein ANN_20667 [Periplaneta americana]|uniref:Receptor ligand binding region domain-containing protein n=1 Tax=Periplaneta americana TaxID=6978 RepID=A0ABQ8SDP7_PERAM|nr:hypothetical protein ANN_20667 [Periplaneta americana]
MGINPGTNTIAGLVASMEIGTKIPKKNKNIQHLKLKQGGEFWEDHFHCRYPNSSPTPYNKKYKNECNITERLHRDNTAFEGQLQFVSDAVMAFAHAFRDMHKELCHGRPGLCDAMKPIKGTELLKYLRKVTFEGLSGDKFRFDPNGDGPARYNIIHFKQTSPGKFQWIKVGEYLEGELRLNMSVILPVVLYGCETWTLTLREEQRLRVLRKIFGAKRDEVTGEWRKLHNIELHALYSSPDIIRNIKSRRLRWAGHVAHMGESRNAYGVLVGRPEGKRPLARPRCRWEDNIKMDLREVGYDGRDGINLAEDRDQWRAYLRASSADFDRTISSLTSVPGNVGDKVNEKTANILSKNPGYYQLKDIQDILKGKTPQKTNKMFYKIAHSFCASPSSCDVERRFSRNKAMLRDNRRRMTTENIRHYLVVNWNSINGAFSNEASTSKSID